MSTRFEGRVAIVTGGASGIGEATARRLAAEGAKVALFDADAANLERVAGEIGAASFVVDIGNEATVRDSVAAVARQYGRLDIAVNSAGVVGPTSTKIVDFDSEAFARVLQINLFGSFYITKYAIPHMLVNNYGRVLLLASIAGKEGNPGMIGYSASKAAVIGIAKAIGKEYAESGITVNAMAPAVIASPMNAKTSPAQLQYMIDRVPMKRLGSVEEAAAMACWIVSEEASFNTGAVFDLSGGRATY